MPYFANPTDLQNGYAVENAANAFLVQYNTTGEEQFYLDTLAQWTFYTNTTDYNAQQAAAADAKFAVWEQQQAATALTFDSSQIQ